MKVLYLSGVDRKRDAVTVRQLSDLDDRLELTTVSSPPDAFEQVRENTEFAALITSAGVARSEILSLLVSLRRDKIDVGVFPVVSESQREFATAALAAGANDVMLQLGDTLINPGEALARILEGRQVRTPAEPKLLRVLYAGGDQLVWKLLEQVPFVKPERAASEAMTAGVFHILGEDGGARCDVVLVDELPDVTQQSAAVRSVRTEVADMPVLALTPPETEEEASSALGLGSQDVIAKTGLYRRPLVAALERLHKTLDQPAARTNGTKPTPQPVATADQPTEVIEPARTSSAIPLDLPASPPEASRPGPVSDTLELDRERSVWEAERTALEARIAEAEKNAARLPDLDASLAGAQQELHALREQHAAAQKEWETVRQNVEGALDATKQELRETLDQRQHDRQELESTVAGLREQVKSLEDTHQVERTRWEEATGTLESRLRAAATAAAKAEFEVTLEAVRADLRQATAARETERNAWSEEREQLETRLATLGRDAETARNDTQASLDAARTELESLRADRDGARAELDGVRQELERERSGLALERGQFENRMAEAHGRLQASLDEARAELDSLRADRDGVQTALDTARQELEHERTAWTQARGQFEGRLADATRAAEETRGELQAQLDGSHGELERVRTELGGTQAERDSVRAELDGLRGDRDAARAELDTARQELEHERSTLAHERDQIEHRIAEASRGADEARHGLQAALDAARAELEGARTELGGTQAERDSVRAELDGLRGDRDAARAELDTARQELEHERAAWTQARGQLESRLADTTRSADEARHGLQAALDGARMELEGAREEARKATETQEQAVNEWARERESFETARAEWDQQRGQLEEQLARGGDADAVLAELEVARAELSTARGDLEGAQAALNETRTELHGTRADRDASRADLDARRQEADAARAELKDAQAALDGTRKELQDVRDRAGRASDAHASEVERWTAERAAWDEERARFDQRLDAAAQAAVSTERDLQSSLDAASTESEVANAALAALRAELDTVKEDARRSSDDHARIEAGWNGEREAWTNERAALEKRAEDEHTAAAAARHDLEAARTHLEEATRWHESQEASWNTAREHLEKHAAAIDAQHTATREELEAKLRDADERMAALRRDAEAHAAELQAARRRGMDGMQRFVQRGSFGYCTTTHDGRLLSCNDAFARILGYSGAEAALQSAGDQVFAPLANRGALDAMLLGSAHAGGVETCLDRIDGRSVRVLESAASVPGPDVGTEAIERVFIDLSGNALLEERLAMAQRVSRVGALASEMAPDIESLLASVADAAARLAPRLDATDPRRADLDEMAAKTGQAGELLKQLMAFSRRQQQPAEPLDVNAVVAGAETMLAQLVGPHIDFEFQPGEPEPITVAEDDLEQLLSAMVVWARDLLPVGGTVRIDTALREGSTEATGVHARHVVLGAHAVGYGVRTSQASEALELMTSRCGGSVSTSAEPGRRATIEVAFARCMPAGLPDRG